MSLTTTRAAFDAARDSHAVIPVCREVFADADTPVGIYRKVAGSRPGTFLLESAEQGGVWTRFSFVGAGSFGVLGERDGHAHWSPNAEFDVTAERLLPGGVDALAPVEALRAVYERWRSPQVDGLPPLASGFVGYLGWETVRQFEKLDNGPVEGPGLPTQGLSFVSELVVIDHREGSVVLLANVLNDAGLSDPATAGSAATEADSLGADTQWADAQARLDALQTALSAPERSPLHTVDRSATASPTRLTSTPEYVAAVEAAQRYIVDGDIFQVVPSQRFDQECVAAPLDVYRVLRHLNPSPYLYLLQLEDAAGEPFAVVGSSPEALVTVQESGHVMMHPIAGSRPRGATIEGDLQHERDLLADDKERAEHLMLLDLGRNDVGRASRPGSVRVTDSYAVELYSHVMHIVSNVTGRLAPDRDALDALFAGFPAGTVSGAPKVRACQIVAELEPEKRGAYAGGVGYFSPDGSMDSCIVLRTAVVKDGTIHAQAGAGIVADSDPASEQRECEAKAGAILAAARDAVTRARV